MRRRKVRQKPEKSREWMKLRQSYFQYRRNAGRTYWNQVLLAIGILNEALLIPDLFFVESVRSKVLIVLFRTGFTAFLLFFLFFCSRSGRFKLCDRMITAAELMAVVLFLFVMAQYRPPNFMIQAAGLYLILLAVCLFPNRYGNMILVAVAGIVGFYALSWVKLGRLSKNEVAASAVYLLATVLICSIFTVGRDRQQFREFLSKEQLIRMNYTDRLTKASSRNRLFSEYAKWQRICFERGRPISLALLDLDKFKSINDRYGHTVADGVLVEFADLVRSCLNDPDLLVRWGGDEFVILFPEADLRDVVRILERINCAVRQNRFVGEIRMTCSFGVVETAEKSPLNSLIRRADCLMYAGKKRGGGRVVSALEDVQFP